MSGLNYTPGLTGKLFLRCQDEMKVIGGPVGSGKTTVCIADILTHAIQMPVSDKGLRRSRMLIVRNTKQQLKDTTLPSVLNFLPAEIYKWKEGDYTLKVRFNDVESDWLFRSLDTPEDVQRVLSLEVTKIWVEEAREVPVPLLSDLAGRAGRFPSQAGGFNYLSGIILSTNPPEIDSDFYKLMEHLPQDDDDPNSVIIATVFKQPSGLSPEAENIENLRPGYYESLSKGKTKNWINVYVHGKYSESQYGKPVYRESFNLDRHVSIEPVRYDSSLPIVVGQDTARKPASVFMQLGLDGRIRILREATAFDMGSDDFIKMKIKPVLINFFSNNFVIFSGDPSWIRQNDTDDNSWYKSLRKEFKKDDGFAVLPAYTNDPLVRINALDKVFRDWPNGQPKVIIDPACVSLIAGLRSKYRYTKTRGSNGQFRETPDKNAWSHVVEAAQYGMLFLTSNDYRVNDYQKHNIKTIDPFAVKGPSVADSYTGY